MRFLYWEFFLHRSVDDTSLSTLISKKKIISVFLYISMRCKYTNKNARRPRIYRSSRFVYSKSMAFPCLQAIDDRRRLVALLNRFVLRTLFDDGSTEEVVAAGVINPLVGEPSIGFRSTSPIQNW